MPRERDFVAEVLASAPEDFVDTRTQVARELRDAGRDEEAGEVASLRKPALPASLANLLAHERSREVAGLLEAAEKVAAAHGAGDPEVLREAQRDLAQRVRGLVDLAATLAGRPLSDAVAQRLAETLRAAATDPQSAPLLRRGVLEKEVETSGFEALAGVKLGGGPARGQEKPGKTDSKSRSRPSTDGRGKRLREELAAAKRELRSAESAAAAAEREATRARKRVSELEARLGRLTR
jgi:hypothetical protein